MIMKTCIILHNMIVDDERGEDLGNVYDAHYVPSRVPSNLSGEVEFTGFVRRFLEIKDPVVNGRLQNDLIEHLWQLQGDSS